MGYTEKDFLCNNTDTVVETKEGKVKGYRFDHINTFLGIPYATAERFMSPKRVAPWEGIKDALGYGWTAPMLKQKGPWTNIINPNRQYPQSEECQNLNVWTPSLDRDAHKPVVVWIHGGGFESGSCVELIAYDGTNIAKEGDVVYVSLTHRLNVLGYLDLSSFGDQYKNSGNLGQEDLVMALEWIHDNIEAFGGDPDNVTIIGQSGGGGKVSTLLQTPAADGLFHKAVIMSGAAIQENGIRRDREVALSILNQFGYGAEDVDKLKKVPLEELIEATNKALKEVFTPISSTGMLMTGMRWEPTKNDWYLGEPSKHGFREHAKHIPVMVGTVLGEFTIRAAMPNKKTASDQEKMDYLRGFFGEHTEKLVELFKQAYPERDIADLAATDAMFREPTIRFADARAKDGCEKTYVYLNNVEMPYDDGIPLWHCGDIDYFFHNTCLSPLHQVKGVTSRVEEQIFGAFMNFCRTGDPNGGTEELPEWPSYAVGKEDVMLFGDDPKVKRNHDRELISSIKKYREKYPVIDF